MGITNVGKSGIALLIGNTGLVPLATAIGSGSGAVAIGNVKLIDEVSRKIFTSTDVSILFETAFVSDWNAVELSGLDFTEFGVFSFSGADTGSCWNREGFPAVNFDGTVELQVQTTYKVT